MLTHIKVIKSKRARTSWTTDHLILIKLDFYNKIYDGGNDTKFLINDAIAL